MSKELSIDVLDKLGFESGEDLFKRPRGRPSSAESAARQGVREALGIVPGPQDGPQSLQKITYKHHSIARLVAEGREDAEIGVLTGYSSGRVCQLRSDPMFRELVAHYSNRIQSIYEETHELRAAVGSLALGRLHDKLNDDESGSDLPALVLTKIAEFALDGPLEAARKYGMSAGSGTNAGVNVSINFQSPNGTPNVPQSPIVDVSPSKENSK